MQNNSNDSTQGWRQRLDEFEDISGNNLDLNAAWEKLEQKKNTVKPSSSKKWYWLAAACMVALLVTLASLFTNNSPGTTNPGIVKAEQPKTEKENSSFIIENAPAIVAEKEPENIIKIENRPERILKVPNDVSPEPLLAKEAIDDASLVIHSPDTIATQPLPVATVAKKLKVVHINELNQTQQGIAKEEGKPYFPITYQTREVYTNADDNNKRGKDNLIRIKLN